MNNNNPTISTTTNTTTDATPSTAGSLTATRGKALRTSLKAGATSCDKITSKNEFGDTIVLWKSC